MDNTKYLLTDYQRWLSGRMAKTTVRKYVADALAFSRTCGHPLYATKPQLAKWFEAVSATTKPSTSNRKLAAIRSLYKYLQEHDLRADDPTALLADRKRDRRLPNPVEHDNIVKLLTLARSKEQESKWRMQDVAILETLYGSGLRRDECARLRLENFINREVLRVIGKGQKERLTIITEPQLQAIMKWLAAWKGESITDVKLEPWFWALKAAEPTMPVFYSQYGPPFLEYGDPGHQVWLRVREYAKEMNLPLRPHRFRHSFGTELVDKDVPLADVADAMGHESIETTRGYVARGEKGLRLIRQKHSQEARG